MYVSTPIRKREVRRLLSFQRPSPSPPTSGGSRPHRDSIPRVATTRKGRKYPAAANGHAVASFSPFFYACRCWRLRPTRSQFLSGLLPHRRIRIQSLLLRFQARGEKRGTACERPPAIPAPPKAPRGAGVAATRSSEAGEPHRTHEGQRDSQHLATSDANPEIARPAGMTAVTCRGFGSPTALCVRVAPTRVGSQSSWGLESSRSVYF